MGRQSVNFGALPDGAGGDTRRVALQKLDANDSELYRYVAFLGAPRNLLINGDGRVNQRVFAGGALAANKYGYDCWRSLGSASSITVAGATVTLSGTNCQIIEAPNLANAMVTVSVTNPSGPITVALQPDGTTATTATGVIQAAAGLQSVTLPVPATLTGNVFVLMTTASAVTIDGPAKRGGIQVELGTIATPFEYPSIADQLSRCERYYQKSFDYATAPANNVVGTIIQATAYQSGSLVGQIPLPVKMRGIPTVTFFSPALGTPSNGQFSALVSGTWTALSATQIFSLREGAIAYTATGPAAITG